MKPVVPPPLQLSVAFALAATAAAVALALLLLHVAVPPVLLALLAVVTLAGFALVERVFLRDVAAIADYAHRLGEGEDATPPAICTPLRPVVSAVTRLRRSAQLQCDQTRAELDANEAILEALHDPFLLVDSHRQVEHANAAARALFGERMVTRDLAASLRNPSILEAVDAVLGGAASRSVEFSLPVPVERMFEVRVKPFRRRRPAATEGVIDAPAEERTAILTLHDITAIKRSEQMRADFIANASHELRTPLSTLLGFIETLRGPARDDDDARDRFLGIMHDQASRMTRLVSDLLSLSRIELDEHMPPGGAVDVVARLQGVLAAFELKAHERRIRLRLVAPASVPPVVGDDDQLTQVFQNLISNAIKYTREQSEVTVTVSVSDGSAVGAASTGGASMGGVRVPRIGGGPMVAVAVADHGEGIARTHLPRLTERFYRVDAARSRALGGTGLGLAIVKHILNRHRGRMTIESEVGVGSTFTVYLPAEAGAQTKAAERRGAA
ncbi:ATP-binding protein [Azospirillum sp.]|uniref:ATP-binding protein n=1 Tax=Azospirillum sp. TaxID=34012 RepID=UPI002D457F4C|nr:ATP-binding protein [Azospirillum sp.]HYD66320.1 ATP-binding protein [Azospirillum sp.]